MECLVVGDECFELLGDGRDGCRECGDLLD